MKKTYKFSWKTFVKEFFSFPGTYLLSTLACIRCRWNPISGRGKRPILLVHGYLHSRFIWLYLGRELQKKGFGPIFTINLGYPFHSIEVFAQKMKEKVKEIENKTKRKDLILIGHSMGGLVSAYFALHVAKKNTVTDVISMATPFHGTKATPFGIGHCVKEMERHSSFVEHLSQNILKEKKIHFYYIAAKRDHIVIPYFSALIGKDKEKQCVLQDVGHSSLLFSKKVSEKLSEWLEKIYQDRGT